MGVGGGWKDRMEAWGSRDGEGFVHEMLVLLLDRRRKWNADEALRMRNETTFEQ